jgi:hypothetical protein
LTGVAWLALSSGNGVLLARLRNATGSLPILDLQPLMPPERLYAILDQYGEQGRDAYLRFALLDVIYPMAACAFFAVVLAALAQPFSVHAAALLLLLPFAGLALELVEQAGFLIILGVYPRRVEAIACFTTSITALKLAVLALLAVSVACLLAWRALSLVRRPTSR